MPIEMDHCLLLPCYTIVVRTAVVKKKKIPVRLSSNARKKKQHIFNITIVGFLIIGTEMVMSTWKCEMAAMSKCKPGQMRIHLSVNTVSKCPHSKGARNR